MERKIKKEKQKIKMKSKMDPGTLNFALLLLFVEMIHGSNAVTQRIASIFFLFVAIFWLLISI